MLRLASLFAWTALVASCAPGLRRFEYGRPAMGTEFRIVLYAEREEHGAAAAEAAFARIAALDRALSDYDPESELERLCARSDEGAPTPFLQVSPDLGKVLAAAATVARQSDGAFDVTVSPCVRLWRRARRQGEVPAPEALARAREAVGFAKLELDAQARAARFLAPEMRLDLGGIAKGYALDEALAVLAAHGCARALVDGGGDVAVGEPPPGREGWRIALAGFDAADARNDRAGAEIELARGAVATSGDLERSFELDGVRYSHILDARTGQPLTGRRLVSAVAATGMLADAWATAVSVLGPEPGLLRAHAAGVETRIVLEQDGLLRVFRSRAFPGELSSLAAPSARAPAPALRP